MRLFLSLLRTSIESASAKRSSLFASASASAAASTAASTAAYPYTGARYRDRPAPYTRGHVLFPARAQPLRRPTNTRAMSSAAADTTTGEGKPEGKPVDVDTTEPVVGEKKEEKEEDEPKLPPLSPTEFREYNRMADHMEYFHNHFRQLWTMLYTACENKKRPAGMSIRRFLDEGLQLASMLTMHHSIEEAHVFPMLAKRMPEFQQPASKGKSSGPSGTGTGTGTDKGSVRAAQLIQQHRAIHDGMDGFEDYLRRCRSGETELELAGLKAQMDTWGAVLWQHLDDEVATLGAENMRKYWTLDEVRRMRM